MVKLGEQIRKPSSVTEGRLTQQVGVQPSPAELRRRIAIAEAERKRKALEKTQEELKNVSLADYETEYKELPEYQKEYFKSPTEIKQTEEYKKYQKYLEQKKKIDNYNREVADWKQAETLARRKVDPFKVGGKSTSVGQKLLKIYEGQNAIQQISKLYNPGSYIDPSGLGYSVKPEDPFLKMIEESKKPFSFEEYAKKYGVSSAEVQRYQDLGYSSKEARELAKASEAAGGMTFVPEYSKEPTTKFYLSSDLTKQDVTRQPTRLDIQPKIDKPKFFAPGTIYESQIGTWKVPGKQKYIPTTKTYFVGEDWTSREATREERERLRDYQTSLSYERGTASMYGPSKLKFEISEAYGKYKDFSSEELFEPTKIEEFFGKAGKPGEVFGGAVYSAVGTRGALIKTGVVAGVSAGAGFAIKGITTGTTAGATALFGKTAGTVTGTSLKLGQYAVGGYYGGKFVLGTTQSIYSTSDYFEKGKIAGRAGLDVAAGLYGFRLGSKGWDIAYGKIRTIGRLKIPEEQIIMKGALEGERYPSKPISQHWEEFQTGSQRLTIKLKGYTGKGEFISPAEVQKLPVKVQPKLYHSTGETFWGKELKVIGDVGDSEFKGLFGGSGVSPTFTRVSGSSSSTKWFPSWKDLTSTSKPGTAVIIPKRFVKGLTGKPGEAFVPGAAGFPKPEIQAIYSPGSTAELIPTGFYYTWKGVNIPLDVFKDITKPTGVTVGLVPTGQPISKILPAYSYYSPPPSIDITAGIVSTYKPPVYSTTKLITSSSIKSPTYEPSMFSSGSIVTSIKPSYKPSIVSKSITSSSGISKISSSIKSSITSSLKRSSTTTIPPSYPPRRPPRKPPIILPPKFKFKFPIPKRRKGKGVPTPIIRFPSLVAIGEQIKSTKPGRFEASGLTIRPILIKTPKIVRSKPTKRKKKK